MMMTMISYLDALINLYSTIGFTCLKTSMTTGEEELINATAGKVVLSDTGCGQPTIINTLEGSRQRLVIF